MNSEVERVRNERDSELMRKGHGRPLRVDGLVKGAKAAIAQGLTFMEYCEMIEKVIISGQPLWVIKMHLEKLEIHLLFGLCPECNVDLTKLEDSDTHGFCLSCGWDNLPELFDILGYEPGNSESIGESHGWLLDSISYEEELVGRKRGG